VEKEEDVPAMLQDVFSYAGPVVVDCRVEKMELVFPMVPAGKGNHEMIGVTK
jgi:acetolactate synthase-1/2/3 large subunit